MTQAAVVIGLVPGLILLLFAIIARVQSKRLPASPGPRFAPMPGSTVLYDALMLDADQRAVAAMLIDMAATRRIRLLTKEDLKGRSVPKRTPLGVEVVPGAPLAVDEIRVLEALFGQDSADGQVHVFSKDRRVIRARLRAALDPANQKLQAAGMFRPHRRRGLWVLKTLAVIAVVVDVIVALVSFDSWGGEVSGALLLASAAIALAALFVAPRPYRLFLPPAAPVRTHLVGMREYMQLAEADQLRALQSTGGALLSHDVSATAKSQELQRFHLHEKLLPYAVLFGLEKSWAAALQSQSATLSHMEGLEATLDSVGDVLEIVDLVGDVVMVVGAVGRVLGGGLTLLAAITD